MQNHTLSSPVICHQQMPADQGEIQGGRQRCDSGKASQAAGESA